MAHRTTLAVEYIASMKDRIITEEEEPTISVYLPAELKNALFLRAIIAGRCERVKDLLDVGADPNSKFPTKTLKDLPALPVTLTAAFGNEEDTFMTALTLAMMLLFKEIRLCVPTLALDSNILSAIDGPHTEPATSELESDGWPRVRCHAAVAAQWAIFVLLLRAGADPNEPSFDSKPPVIWALSTARCIYPVLRHLMHAGADPSRTGPFSRYIVLSTLMGRPRWFTDHKALRVVLEHGGQLDPAAAPPLSSIAAYMWTDDMIPTLELFLELGHDVDTPLAGKTPLITAIEHKNMTYVAWLLRQGTNVYAPSRDGRNALTEAKRVNAMEPLIAALQNAGGIPTRTPFVIHLSLRISRIP